jgi:hypothetical protein
MRLRITFAGLAPAAALVSGCAAHPIAFSRVDWESLTPGPRAHVRAREARPTRQDFQPLLHSGGRSKDRVEKVSDSTAERGAELLAGW